MASFLGLIYFLLNESFSNSVIFAFFFILFFALSYVVFYKISSIFIKVNFIFFYVGYLLSMPIFFYNKSQYSYSGWKGIRGYNFEYLQTLDVLSLVASYLCLFVFFAWIVDRILLNTYKVKAFDGGNIFPEIQRKFSKYWWPLLGLIIAQYFLSYIMFAYKIGVVGVSPEEGLPFKVAGLLYYYRYFVIPVLFFFLLFTRYHKQHNVVILLILAEILISGMFSVSRAIVIIHSLPVLIFLATKRRFVFLGIVSLYILIVVSFVSLAREYTYGLYNFHNAEMLRLFDFGLLYSFISLENILQYFFTIVMRFQGIFEFVAVFFGDIEYVDRNLFVNTVLGFGSFDFGDFNVTKDVFNIDVPAGKDFGAPIDPFGYLYLSVKSIPDLLFLIFLWVLLLVGVEKVLNLSFPRSRNSSIFILFLSFYSMLGYIHPGVKGVFVLVPMMLLLLRIFSLLLRKYKV